MYKHFLDYLSNENSSTIFLQPTDKEEIANIISSLNSNKVSGPNSIPYRILFLLKNKISKIDRFIQPKTGVFPSVLKGTEATCVEIATEMKKCFRLKGMLNVIVL